MQAESTSTSNFTSPSQFSQSQNNNFRQSFTTKISFTDLQNQAQGYADLIQIDSFLLQQKKDGDIYITQGQITVTGEDLDIPCYCESIKNNILNGSSILKNGQSEDAHEFFFKAMLDIDDIRSEYKDVNCKTLLKLEFICLFNQSLANIYKKNFKGALKQATQLIKIEVNNASYALILKCLLLNNQYLDGIQIMTGYALLLTNNTSLTQNVYSFLMQAIKQVEDADCIQYFERNLPSFEKPTSQIEPMGCKRPLNLQNKFKKKNQERAYQQQQNTQTMNNNFSNFQKRKCRTEARRANINIRPKDSGPIKKLFFEDEKNDQQKNSQQQGSDKKKFKKVLRSMNNTYQNNSRNQEQSFRFDNQPNFNEESQFYQDSNLQNQTFDFSQWNMNDFSEPTMDNSQNFRSFEDLPYMNRSQSYQTTTNSNDYQQSFGNSQFQDNMNRSYQSSNFNSNNFSSQNYDEKFNNFSNDQQYQQEQNHSSQDYFNNIQQEQQPQQQFPQSDFFNSEREFQRESWRETDQNFSTQSQTKQKNYGQKIHFKDYEENDDNLFSNREKSQKEFSNQSQKSYQGSSQQQYPNQSSQQSYSNSQQSTSSQQNQFERRKSHQTSTNLKKESYQQQQQMPETDNKYFRKTQSSYEQASSKEKNYSQQSQSSFEKAAYDNNNATTHTFSQANQKKASFSSKIPSFESNLNSKQPPSNPQDAYNETQFYSDKKFTHQHQNKEPKIPENYQKASYLDPKGSFTNKRYEEPYASDYTTKQHPQSHRQSSNVYKRPQFGAQQQMNHQQNDLFYQAKKKVYRPKQNIVDDDEDDLVQSPLNFSQMTFLQIIVCLVVCGLAFLYISEKLSGFFAANNSVRIE